MIKFMQCVRRKADISPLTFHRYWNEYRDAVQAVASAAGALRVTANTTLAVEQNIRIMMARGTGVPFDGVIEVVWEKGEDALANLGRQHVQQCLEAMRQLQEKFMDLDRCSFFFTAEDVVLDRAG